MDSWSTSSNDTCSDILLFIKEVEKKERRYIIDASSSNSITDNYSFSYRAMYLLQVIVITNFPRLFLAERHNTMNAGGL